MGEQHQMGSALHAAEATRLATGNLDGSGGRELIAAFPGLGLWRPTRQAPGGRSCIRRMRQRSSPPISTAPAGTICGGQLPGTGPLDLPQQHGVGAAEPVQRRSSRRWRHRRNDAGGFLVVDFGGTNGIWAFRNNTTWTGLHHLNSQGITWATSMPAAETIWSSISGRHTERGSSRISAPGVR